MKKLKLRTPEWVEIHKTSRHPKHGATGKDKYYDLSDIINDNKIPHSKRIIEEIDLNSYKNLRIIELGPGNSGLCKELISNFKIKKYTLVDDKTVLEVAKKNLAEFNNGIIDYVPIEDISKVNSDFDIFISFNCMTETPIEYQEYIYKTFFPRCNEVLICDRWEGYKFDRKCEPFRDLLNKYLHLNFDKYLDKPGTSNCRKGQWIIHGYNEK